jgi:hypothetical protein
MQVSTSPEKVGPVVPVPPDDVVSDPSYGCPSLRGRGIETEMSQEQQRVGGARPVLRILLSAPLSLVILETEQARSPSLLGNTGSFRRDRFRRRVGQVPHHLPAHRRIGIEQPVRNVHSHLLSSKSPHRRPVRSGAVGFGEI